MKGLTITSSLLLAASSLTTALPTILRRDDTDNWNQTLPAFLPGGSVPSDCLKNPSYTPCPGKLANGNFLITSYNQVVYLQYPETNMRTKTNTVQNDAAQAGYSTDGTSAYEVSTLSIFHNFPAGYEGNQCKFHFIYDEGTNIPALPGKFAVWSISGPPAATLHSTWNTKPQRVEQVAGFNATVFVPGAIDKEAAASKMSAQFLSGPGEGSPEGTTFPCPGAGDFAWEIAPDKSVVMDTQDVINQGGPFNVGGNNGLAMEVIGVQDPYW